jgi:hypothetical protein
MVIKRVQITCYVKRVVKSEEFHFLFREDWVSRPKNAEGEVYDQYMVAELASVFIDVPF